MILGCSPNRKRKFRHAKPIGQIVEVPEERAEENQEPRSNDRGNFASLWWMQDDSTLDGAASSEPNESTTNTTQYYLSNRKNSSDFDEKPDLGTIGDVKSLYEQALQSIEHLLQHELENHPLEFDDALLCSDDSDAVWSYDPKNHLIRADFSDVEHMTIGDIAKLAYLMQRDDLTLISKGLFMKIDDIEEFINYIGSNRRVYHKFRRYVKNNETDRYEEVDGYAEMTPQQYAMYLKARQTPGSNDTVNYCTSDGKVHMTKANDIILYMVDVDVSQQYPQLSKKYTDTCKWPDVLPGGNLCMMGQMPRSMQPFMGPNLYISPGQAYTMFHQDGFGSVDSGHSNLYGTNEVVMLRRLPAETPLHYGVMYHMPHEDGGPQQDWPTHETIQEWENLNYGPSRFLLFAGEHLHIHKGRWHAFRKLANETLPDTDCHSDLRREFLQQHDIQHDLCVSIAFDWMYLGFQANAIHREVMIVLEAARRIRLRKKAKTLAVGETAVFTLAEAITGDAMNIHTSHVVPDKAAIAKGVISALTYLVKRDTKENIIDTTAVVPVDADEDPAYRLTDPYGNDYFCKLCDNELANTYFHCQGCEELLQMDFNICRYCFDEEGYRTNIEMKLYARGKSGCHLHHTAAYGLTRCTSNIGSCSFCDTVCAECACDCHHKFAKRHRFRSDAETRQLLQNCRDLAGVVDYEDEDETSEFGSVDSSVSSNFSPILQETLVGSRVFDLQTYG